MYSVYKGDYSMFLTVLSFQSIYLKYAFFRKVACRVYILKRYAVDCVQKEGVPCLHKKKVQQFRSFSKSIFVNAFMDREWDHPLRLTAIFFG
jgi:hypothetical protein